ncbi:sigma-70 family RNA polymerase sigma factor [Sulfurospirillum sp. SCADC]|uniref:RNA polymerase sigma factor n=1 Tax=unclassified Sulfurospirillum TaxID=2618290 RepID=UPI0034177A0D
MKLLDEQIRQETLKACIKNLSPQNKKAFVLYYYKGYSRQEIAQMMGISTNAVKKISPEPFFNSKNRV